MHLPDGFLNATTCAGAGVVAVGALALAVRRTRTDVGDRLVPLMGVMSACVFAAQMVNFPIFWGTSGHLLGAVLAAIVLGPWAALLAMTVVLVVQCFLFYDGGPIALGANVLNMAVIGALGGYAVYALARRLVGGPKGQVAGAVIASWVSVQLAAAACAGELWWSGTYTLHTVLPAMLVVHSAIGIGEALITGSVVAFLVSVRPDLLYASHVEDHAPGRLRHAAAAGLALALVIAFCLSPLASAAPDGLERVAENLGNPAAAPAGAPGVIPLADYQLPWLAGAWWATSIAGIIGALVVFVLAWYLSRGLLRVPTSH